MYKTFGETIASLRRAHGMRQQTLADALAEAGVPVSNQAVSKWENDATLPNAQQFLTLCRVLDVDDIAGTFSGGDAGGLLAGLNAEGRRRALQAQQGVSELMGRVDSLLIIPNDRLKYATDQKVTLANAFEIADDVLRQAVQSISDLIRDTGFINLDFADVTAIMKNAGMAHMGVGRAAGKGKAEEAARMAISSPLLETSIHGARGVLINVTGSMDIGLEEVEQAASLVQDAVHPDALTIFGATFDESMDDEIRVTVIATGFADGKSAAAAAPAEEKKAAEAKPGIEPINYEEDKAAAEAEKKTEEEDDPFADIFKIFNRER